MTEEERQPCLCCNKIENGVPVECEFENSCKKLLNEEENSEIIDVDVSDIKQSIKTDCEIKLCKCKHVNNSDGTREISSDNETVENATSELTSESENGVDSSSVSQKDVVNESNEEEATKEKVGGLLFFSYLVTPRFTI